MSGFRRGLIANAATTASAFLRIIPNSAVNSDTINIFIDGVLVVTISSATAETVIPVAPGAIWLTARESADDNKLNCVDIDDQLYVWCTDNPNMSLDHRWGFPIEVAAGQTVSVRFREFECFVEGTLISLADGTTKPIEDITYNDALLVWNFDEGRLDAAKPAWIKKEAVVDHYYENEFDNGTILNVTGLNPYGHVGHEMFVVDDQTFDYIPEIVGKTAYSLSGNTKLIRSEKKLAEVRYYNIITKHHFNLFANGILTSCSLNKLYPIRDMKFIKTLTDTDMTIYDGVPDRQLVSDLRLAEMPDNKLAYVENLIRTDIRNNQ